MAAKHGEIIRHQSGGWTVAWDANTVEPATRKVFDKVIADNARALREVLREPVDGTRSQAARTTARTRPAQARAARGSRAA